MDDDAIVSDLAAHRRAKRRRDARPGATAAVSNPGADASATPAAPTPVTSIAARAARYDEPLQRPIRHSAARPALESPAVDDGDERSGAIERAFDVTCRSLGRSDKSVEEVRRALASDEALDAAGIESILERCTELGYLDDERFAATLVDRLLHRKRLGRAGLERELRARLLDHDTIEQALASVDRDDEYARAGELAESRAERLRGVEPEAAMRRLTAFLVRRGFSHGVATIAAGEALHGGGTRSAHTDDARQRVFFGNTSDDD